MRLVFAGREEEAAKTKEEDDALAAAFNARLQKEGGATQFKIKTTLNDAKDVIKDSASQVTNVAKKVEVPSADSVLNASPAATIGGLFAIVILFTVVSAGLNSGPSDKFTSDGTTLEFGQRSQLRDVPLNAYRPEYGTQ